MNKKYLLPIFLIVLADVLGLTIVLPLLPFYAEKFGATPFTIGCLVASFAACQLIAGPLLGQASDKMGRRPLLLVSQVGTFIGFLMLAFAQSLFMVFVARIIDGITAGNLSLAQAYITDVTAPEDRAKAFGVIGIAFGIGFLIGPAFSGILAQYDYRYPILAAAFLSATSIAATYFILPPPPEHSENSAVGDTGPGGKRLGILDWSHYISYFKRPELGPILFQFFFFAFAFATFTSGFALFAQKRLSYGPSQVGYVFAYAGFLGIILQGGLIGRLVKKFGESKLALSGFLSMMLGYGALGFTQNLGELIPAATLSSYGNGILRPSLTSLATRRTSRHEHGVVLGLTQSMTSVSQIIAPLIAGQLIETGALTAWALVASVTALLGLLLGLSKRARASHTLSK
jgi:MFS family permease